MPIATNPPLTRPLYLLEASTFWMRWRGWKACSQGADFTTAVWLRPCRAVHMWGMQQALDICFLDEADHPLRFCPAVPIGGVRLCRRARSVLEAPVSYLSGPEQFAPWAAALRQLRQTGGGVWLDWV